MYTSQGGGYHNDTGFFQAPVPGVYYFIATAAGASPHNPTQFHLSVDDTSTISSGYSFFNGQAMEGRFSTAHGVMLLRQGQKVWIRSDGSTYDGVDHTMFSGFLLYPDSS